MKKIIALCLALLLCVVALAACNDNKNPPAGSTTAGSTTAGTPDNTTATTESTTAGSTTTGGNVTPPAPQYDVDSAAEFLKSLYKTYLTANKTGADFEMVSQVMVAGTAYTVTWTTDTDKVTVTVNEADKSVTINVDENATEDLAYVLTATVADPDGKTAQISFNLVVPKFAVNTFAEYAAAEDDAPLVVAGIVTGVFSKATGSNANGLYIQDLNNEGGYYVYNLTDDPNGVILPGMTVQVRGIKDTYNGTYELINASVEIIDSTIKTVTPVDYTEILANAAQLSDAALVAKQALLVSISGATVLEVGDNGYYYFQLGAHKTYLRISSSNNATTDEALAAIIAAHGANYGNTATITGVISIYSGNFYLSPVSAEAFSNFVIPERTDAEKLEFEVGALKVPSKLTSDSIIQLPLTGATYEDVTFAWTSDSEYAVIGADGKMTVTVPTEAVTVTLTAVITIGEESKTQTYTIELSQEATPLDEIIKIGEALTSGQSTAEKYIVQGVIVEIYNETYGNAYIIDGNGNKLTVYGIVDAEDNRFDAMATKPAVGDFVTFLSVVSNYNGNAQLKNAVPTEIVSPTTIPDATEIGNALGVNNATSENMHLVTGVITGSIQATYGNCNIVDGDGNTLYIYGLYDAAGNRYDAMTTKPVEGDTITVYSYISYFNNPQLKNAVVVGYVKGEGNNGDNTPEGLPSEKTSIADAIEIGSSLAPNASTTDMYLIEGIITNLSNTTWGNGTISDGNGNSIEIYGLYDATGDVRYDALTTKPVVGDTVVLYSILNKYNETLQLKNARVISVTAGNGNNNDGTQGGTTPTPTLGNSFDFSTLPTGDNGTAYAERNAENGWKVVGAAVVTNSADAAAFMNGASYVILNGKTTNAGKLTSATIANGISKLVFNYGFPYTDTQVSLNISIKQNGEVVASTTLDASNLTKLTAYSFEWTLDTAVEGEFVLEIENTCKSQKADGNKDRVAIWNLSWEN